MTSSVDLARRIRIHALHMTSNGGSSHVGSVFSIADILAVLYSGVLRVDPARPGWGGRDRFVLSKGHAGAGVYAALAEVGFFPVENLKTHHQNGSDLSGHVSHKGIPGVELSTGSLGHCLSVGAGMALAQRLDKSPARTFVLLGDGECAEGQVWEAAAAASYWKLRNLVAVVDVNRLGQSDLTMHQHDLQALRRKFAAFGWDAVVIDGHKIDRILPALAGAGKTGKPTAVLARTLKGKGVSFIEDKNGWHGKPLKAESGLALEELIVSRDSVIHIRPFRKTKAVVAADFPRTAYKERTATRLAYGNALLSLAKADPAVVAIDGDVKNSTYADKFFETFPARTFQSFIAEQNMVGVGIGLAAKGYVPFMATFAAFLTRAHDQVRMAAYSFANIKLCGSHVGVSIGEDGPSQMGLEDRCSGRPRVPRPYPSDARSRSRFDRCARMVSSGRRGHAEPRGRRATVSGSRSWERTATRRRVAAGITVRGPQGPGRAREDGRPRSGHRCLFGRPARRRDARPRDRGNGRPGRRRGGPFRRRRAG
jgi:transketolase